MEYRELRIKLPCGLPADRYEGIRRAVFSFLTLWDIEDPTVDLEDELDSQPAPGPASLPQHP